MGILAWIVLGLVAGLIARAIYPGPQPGGVLATILLGIVGAVVGGWIGRGVAGSPGYSALSFGSIVWSVLGALVVLFVYTMATKRRALPPGR